MNDSLNNQKFHPPVRGRGALQNPDGRFERQERTADADAYETLYQAGEDDFQGGQVKTEVFKDTSRTIVTNVESPDVGMEATINPYRGCEHGCIYCYARPTHEYLGMSAGLDFENKIFVKEDASALLIEKLKSKTWTPKVLTLSGITDPYQPLEKKLEVTRRCFEVLRDFNNPAAVITKNHLVTRDIDIFKDMAAQDKIFVSVSVTTLDPALARTMEPRTSRPDKRLKAIEMLSNAGVPVGVMMGPVLPGLTDHEIPQLLKAVANAGALTANYTMLRLPYGVKDLFTHWIETHYPDRAQKVLNRMRDMYDGKLYSAEFGTRMRGKGIFAEQIAQVFTLYKKKYRLNQKINLTLDGFNARAYDAQLTLF